MKRGYLYYGMSSKPSFHGTPGTSQGFFCVGICRIQLCNLHSNAFLGIVLRQLPSVEIAGFVEKANRKQIEQRFPLRQSKKKYACAFVLFWSEMYELAETLKNNSIFFISLSTFRTTDYKVISLLICTTLPQLIFLCLQKRVTFSNKTNFVYSENYVYNSVI